MTAKRTADCDEALVYEIACNEQAEEEDVYLAECERRGVKPEKPKRLSKTETCIRIGTLKGIEIGTRKGVQMCQPKIDALERDLDEARNAVVKLALQRPSDCEVTQEELSKLLKGKECPRERRQILRWEKYLKTNGKKGTKPPEGYTLQTRLTFKTAAAWVESFAATEKSKLNIKISLEARFGGRG